MENKSRKNERLYVRAKPEQIKRLQIVKEETEIPISQLVRTAIDEKIEQIANEDPRVRVRLDLLAA